MPPVRKTVDVWVVIDADGDYALGSSADIARDAYTDDIGGSGPRREIHLSLSVPLPVTLELSGTVPDEPTDAPITLTATE